MEESLGETARNSFTKEFRAEKRTKFFCGRNFLPNNVRRHCVRRFSAKTKERKTKRQRRTALEKICLQPCRQCI